MLLSIFFIVAVMTACGGGDEVSESPDMAVSDASISDLDTSPDKDLDRPTDSSTSDAEANDPWSNGRDCEQSEAFGRISGEPDGAAISTTRGRSLESLRQFNGGELLNVQILDVPRVENATLVSGGETIRVSVGRSTQHEAPRHGYLLILLNGQPVEFQATRWIEEPPEGPSEVANTRLYRIDNHRSAELLDASFQAPSDQGVYRVEVIQMVFYPQNPIRTIASNQKFALYVDGARSWELTSCLYSYVPDAPIEGEFIGYFPRNSSTLTPDVAEWQIQDALDLPPLRLKVDEPVRFKISTATRSQIRRARNALISSFLAPTRQ